MNLKFDFKNYNYSRFFIISIVFLILFFLIKIITPVIGKTIILTLLVFLLLLALSKFKNLTKHWKSVAVGYVISLTIISSFWIVKQVIWNFKNPHDWDFLCFYLYGKVAASGLNFYIPSYYHDILNSLTLPFTLSSDFINGALVFQYFPPNIFYFLPLGFLNFNSAHIIWVITNGIFLVVDIYLVWKYFSGQIEIKTFLAVATLFFLLPGTQTAIYFEHYTFILMFPLLLAWKDRDLPRSGIWLSIGIFTKPLLIILLIYPLIRRQWKTILAIFLTSSIIILLNITVFGYNEFVTFLNHNPNSYLPNDDYIEWENQSLLATILRLTNYNFNYITPLMHPLFIILCMFFIIITLILVYRIDIQKSEWGFSLILLMSLIIYPGSLNSYSPLIIPILTLLFFQHKNNYFNKWITMIVIASVYSIMKLNPFASHIILWFTVAFLILKVMIPRESSRDSVKQFEASYKVPKHN